MRKNSSYTLRYFLIVILAFLSFKGIAQIPEFLNVNKTPLLKPYDYSAEYDGLKGPVKEVITFKGRISSVFGNKTLVKDGLVGHVKYLPDGLRMEAHIGAPHSLLYDGVKYIFKNERPDTLLIYKYYDEIQGYSERPTEMITYDYLTQDSIIEKYYEYKEVHYGKKDWEQTKQLNLKIIPGGFKSIFFPDVNDEGEISLYTNRGFNFNFKDERRDFFGYPNIMFNNSLFRIDKLFLIEKAVRYIGRLHGDMRTGEIKTDDLGRIIRIRPSQKKLNQLLSDGNNSYKATHLEYDENGNISKIVYSKYFTSGSRQNRKWEHIEDNVIKVDYTYDSYGNWTMAKITTYDQPLDRDLPSYGEVRNKEESYYIREISYYSDNDKTPPTSFFVKEEKIDDGIGQPIYDNVEQTPTYPGGKYRLTEDIVVGLPDKYKSEGEGKYPAQILVKFAVYKSGKIDNLEIIEGGENLSEDESNEIMAAFKQLDSFTPGKNNGQPVNSWFTFPVQLYLSFSQLNEDAKREAELKREQDAQEEAKRICTFAYQAIEQCSLWKEFNNMSKSLKGSDAVAAIPNMGTSKGSDYKVSENINIEKLKDYEINGNEYTFTKNDKSIIPNVSFNRIVRDLDYSYHNFGYLSDDKKCALIIYRNSRVEDFIYIVELEGNEIKTINYIPYKKSKDFVMPQIQK
ncbi:MAG: hypothetical protein ACI30P_07970 [Muribaculaceae bacterium]